VSKFQPMKFPFPQYMPFADFAALRQARPCSVHTSSLVIFTSLRSYSLPTALSVTRPHLSGPQHLAARQLLYHDQVIMWGPADIYFQTPNYRPSNIKTTIKIWNMFSSGHRFSTKFSGLTPRSRLTPAILLYPMELAVSLAAEADG
jgi:hypothetical protein